jgi:hypothetical protein
VWANEGALTTVRLSLINLNVVTVNNEVTV